MTHLPFVAGAYGAAIACFATLGVSAALRLRSAERRLRAIGHRGRRSGA